MSESNDKQSTKNNQKTNGIDQNHSNINNPIEIDETTLIDDCDRSKLVKPTNGSLQSDDNDIKIDIERSPTKSILSNGNLTSQKRGLKKSVSFDPEDEVIKKFIEGEVIVDKKNPFKNGLLIEPTLDRKVIVKIKKGSDKNKIQDENDFVSTEEVLRESKYVKTYIKNPDKYFTYDPTVVARIKFEELRELGDKKPQRKIRLSTQTQERLKELKTKCSPSALHAQSKSPNSKIPTFKRVSNSKYPDLSQIKVKTGTDLETSLFNPEEVTINAKKFDERAKTLHLSSDDDLEEIEEQLTKSDSSDELKTTDQTDSEAKKDEKGSFTNTVNSREFQEYLNKKGLSLTPKLSRVSNGNITANKAERQDKTKSDSSTLEMEPKKVKKPSVFQRLLPSSIFSSKRKTTPKEPVPTPQSLYANTNDDVKNSSTIKRVILERQSFHEGSGNSTNTSNDLRKQMERSRKSYGGDDHSSSISSALTNAEDFGDAQSNNSAFGQRSSSETLGSKSARSRTSTASLSKERLHNFQTKSAEVREGIVKPRVQRANLPISALKPLPSKSVERNEKQAIPIRRTLERQSLVQKRPNIGNDDTFGSFGRCSSMDRQDITKRSQNRLNISQQKPSRNSTASQKSVGTPRSSREDLLESGPKMTSTPLSEAEKAEKAKLNRLPNLKITIPNATQVVEPPPEFNVGPDEWVKLREMKEKTDRELYNRVVNRQPKGNENIYERLPAQAQQPQTRHSLSPPNQPLYTQLIPEGNFMRGSAQRNTISTPYGNRNVKIIDGATINAPEKQMIPIEPAIKITNNPQPPRCQSVLDEMMSPQHHQPVYGSVTGTPVIMRRKDTPSLTREEILQRVKEFCRKSINKTPTKLGGSINQLHKEANGKVPSDVSPVSYASVEYQNRSIPKIVAPQVPQRVQSLQNSQASPQTPSTSPIYAHVIKRNSIQSNVSDMYDNPQRNLPPTRPRASTITSDTDSVFLSTTQPSPSSPARFVVMDSEKVTPVHVMKYRNDVYGQVMPNPYGYIQLKPPIPQSRTRMDGRSTPLMLDRPQPSPIYWNAAQQQSPRYSQPSQQQQQPQTQPQNQPQQSPHSQNSGNNVVYLKVKDQVYRPITSTGRYYPIAKPPPNARFYPYESESGSEAGEVQRIMQNRRVEEDWQNDKSGRSQSSEQATDDRRRAARREDPRRHTLGGDMLQYGGGQGQPQQRAMDLEMGTRAQKSKKAPPVRGYTPINQGPLFDEDPGIMSEVETASTGFRRGGKQRSSLPVVRTPSKTLERPLGLVFLQYRSETKRALLPNEITSIDTVRALFVRSFPRQLTMAYLEGPNVKIYIHDASKDMFYELEDVRSHLREIRDRSVLRLFESNEVAAPQVLPGGPGIPQPLPPAAAPGHWDQDQSYFSEPEFDSEYQHQHIHKSKGGKPAPYYVGSTQTLPHRGMYSDRTKNAVDGYTSSPERGTRGGYEEPYYSQYGTRGATVTPIIDEEQRCTEALTEDQYALYGMKVAGRIPRNPNQLYDPTRPEDLHRIRVEHMERQLANLTGLVQKALNQNPPMGPQVGAINANYLGVPGQCRGERDRLKPPPPPKPLALASTHPNYRPDIALAPEVYNHLRGLQKKAKDLRMEVRTLRRLSQAQAVAVREDIKDAFMRIRATLLASTSSYWGQGDVEKTRLSREEELYKQEVIRLEKDLSDLEASVEGLRGEVINRRTRVNMAAVEDMALVLSRASKTVAELKMRFPGLQQGLRNILANEMEKVVREEKFLKEEPDRLESALRRCKKLTGTLVTLKRLASVQEQRLPANEPVNEDPPRSAEISSANKPIPSPRMGSITVSGGVPPENALDALLDELQTFAKPQSQSGDTRPDDSTSDDSSQTLQNTITTQLSQSSLFPNDPNAPQVNNTGNITSNTLSTNVGSLRRLHSYPSGSDTDTSPPQPSRPVGKPPVPERNADLLSKVSNKRIPPPPPPRTSSRSPLASPTSPNIPQRLPSLCESDQVGNGSGSGQDGSGNSSGNESGNDHVQRQLALEMRHQELLKKQKMLQEQYARLQQMSKNSIALPPSDILQLKKTGSESNLPQKMGLSLTVTGSMKNLNSEVSVAEKNEKNLANSTAAIDASTTNNKNSSASATGPGQTTTNKVYETDIL